MPHCIIEYAPSVESQLAPEKLIVIVHQGAVESGLFEAHDIKTRATAFRYGQVGTSNKSYIHVIAKILSGRTLAQRQHLSNSILEQLVALHLRDISLSVEVVEMEKASYAKVVN